MNLDERVAVSADFDTESSFRDESFEGLDLVDQRLVGRDFDGCRFMSCRFQESLWDRCRFVGCEFRSCDLSLLKPRDSSFRDVTFVDCRLAGIDWTQAETTLGLDVGFERSILDGSSFMKLALRGVRMIECRCEGVSFVGADLSESEFTGTDLLESQFSSAELTRADLSRASNLRFDPRECRLKDTRVSLEAGLALLGELGVVVPDLE